MPQLTITVPPLRDPRAALKVIVRDANANFAELATLAGVTIAPMQLPPLRDFDAALTKFAAEADAAFALLDETEA